MTSRPGNTPADTDTPLRVLVADDQTTVREGLVTLLGLSPGIQVVGAAADGAQAITLTAELHPDVVLMDLGMPVVDGVTATARIRIEHPDTQVVVLTTFADDTNILAALRAGALGYLTKDAGRAQIARALHTAAAGQAVLDTAVHARLLAAATQGGVPPGRRRAAAGRPHHPRSRGPRPHRRRPDQRPNRRPALRHRGHREDPHQPPVQQGRPARPRPGRHLRPPPPPHRPASSVMPIPGHPRVSTGRLGNRGTGIGIGAGRRVHSASR